MHQRTHNNVQHSVSSAAFIALLLCSVTFPTFAQNNEIETTQALSPFGGTTVRAETSAYLAAWNQETRSGIIAVDYVFPEGYHQIDNDDFFRIRPEPTPGFVFGATLKGEPIYNDGLAEYFDETTLLIEFHVGDRNNGNNADTGDAAAPNTVTDADNVARTKIDSSEPVKIQLAALFQICDENGTCLFPDQENHTLLFDPNNTPGIEASSRIATIKNWAGRTQDGSERGDNAGLSNSAGRAIRNENSENAIGSIGSSFAGSGQAAGRSIFLFLIMAFLGGILLNIMPCVLPLLSVKALGLVKQAGEDRRSLLKHAWLYVVGIEASFITLAAIVIGLQASGRLLGWGFQFQSPIFVILLTAVIWIFALSLFDVFLIQAPQKGLQGALKAGSKGGYLGSFLTGIFAVLVATPCTAPFLGAALGFAFSQSAVVILAIFAVTGLGLGLPFLLLGLWPGFFKKMPKPGAWMNTFKEVMGFLLVATAVYLFTTFAKLAPALVGRGLWWLLALGFSAWLFGKTRAAPATKTFRIVGTLLALSIAVSSGFILIDLSRADDSPVAVRPIKTDYLIFNEVDIENRIEAGEPVFLEFTAAWCTTCKVNQRIINASEIRNLMAQKGVVHIIGDLTAYDETMTRWLNDFGRAGVPLYVLYRPVGEPHLFPEFLTFDMLRSELEQLPDV